MDKIEMPENREILQFLNKLADYCIPMDGGKMRMTAQVWPIIKARDAAIRTECAERAVACFLKCMVESDLATGQDHAVLVISGKLRAAIMAKPKEGV